MEPIFYRNCKDKEKSFDDYAGFMFGLMNPQFKLFIFNLF
jgi:hypothetical protein